ncbi:hypothetical protein PoB_002880900 [Plakobranchus ocellatus]|uniref:Uncharacterized protein n=1 Tax=Plakobranchus ocellatus TaxID=259542 RepID=A0AAV4A6X7_9GAST|nr:hypothetical protein PoB_002880900 [Plakobranchus ocellatus]
MVKSVKHCVRSEGITSSALEGKRLSAAAGVGRVRGLGRSGLGLAWPLNLICCIDAGWRQELESLSQGVLAAKNTRRRRLLDTPIVIRFALSPIWNRLEHRRQFALRLQVDTIEDFRIPTKKKRAGR